MADHCGLADVRLPALSAPDEPPRPGSLKGTSLSTQSLESMNAKKRHESVEIPLTMTARILTVHSGIAQPVKSQSTLPGGRERHP
jgi:hypothetical protein